MRVYLRTFGCRANQYDTEAARAMIEAGGGVIVERAADAEIALFNSCAVTSGAEADLRKAVRREARLDAGEGGARTGALRTIVMGCASALDDGTIAALPGVSDVIAGADLPALAQALGLDPALSTARTGTQAGARALLRIQDGCDEHCTFCATTLARGAQRSRPPDELVREALALSEHHPEIVITGIHIGTYGAEAGSSLGALVMRLVREVPRARFRLTSIEATEVDDRLAELLTGHPAGVVPHLHAPLQSGSDRVLRRMGRHWYDASTYAAAVERLAAARSTFALGADLIAGFPGETGEDHGATRSLVRDLPFTYLHVFPFSPRPLTAAERLRGRVAPAVARERAAELRTLGTDKAAAYRTSRVGAPADVVVVGEGWRREGLTEDYLTVTLEDRRLPRRARFASTLSLVDGQLTACTR
ncbi:MAG: MiaB/RimO family radical SAM methylthiotransferase [Gemmatimonadales bacterium]